MIGCYGLPFIPAFIYFFIHTPTRGRIYGSAIVRILCLFYTIIYSPSLTPSFSSQLWCWVARPWSFLRIALFYGPVWFVISLTFAIYLRAGSAIYQKRRELRTLDTFDTLETEIATLAGIQVTSEIACSTPERQSVADPNVDIPVPARSFSSSHLSPYSVTIEGGMMDEISTYQNSEERLPSIQASSTNPGPRLSVSQKTCRSNSADMYSQQRGINREASSAAWAYTKYAMLFFIALLVTWVCYLPRAMPAQFSSRLASFLTCLWK